MKKAFQTDEVVSGAGRLAVLGHPVRLAMVRELVWAVVIYHGQPPPFSGGAVTALSVAELATRLGMKRAAVGNHLPQMLRSGLVTVVCDAGGDGRKRCLALAASAMVRETPNAGVETPSAVLEAPGAGLEAPGGREVDWGDVAVRFAR